MNRHQRRRRISRAYRKRGRRYDNGTRRAVRRALAAGVMYLDAGDITLRTAAELCGSNAHYVAAAVVILKSEDRALQELVLDGKVPLLAAAKAMEQTANLVAAYRAADNAIKSVFTCTVSAGAIWDECITPVLDAGSAGTAADAHAA